MDHHLHGQFQPGWQVAVGGGLGGGVGKADGIISDIPLRVGETPEAESEAAVTLARTFIGNSCRTKLAVHTFLLAMQQACSAVFRLQGRMFLSTTWSRYRRRCWTPCSTRWPCSTISWRWKS